MDKQNQHPFGFVVRNLVILGTYSIAATSSYHHLIIEIISFKSAEEKQNAQSCASQCKWHEENKTILFLEECSIHRLAVKN